jgi:hypothetical protein
VDCLPADLGIIDRWLQGGRSLNPSDMKTAEGRALAHLATQANGASRNETLDRFLASLPSDRDAERVRTGLALVSSKDAPVPVREVSLPSSMPSLSTEVLSGATPEEWLHKTESDAGSRAGAWVDTYVEHSQAASPMTPTPFHESLALVLAAIMIARRVQVQMPHGVVYPNLYVIWIADTTLWRKSTALGYGRDLAADVAPHLLAAQDTTPEALIADLAGKQPRNYESMTPGEQEAWQARQNFAGQRGLLVDEISGLFAGWGRDYNAGQLEMLLRLYDNEEHYTRSTRADGWISIHNSSLSLLGATTPSASRPYLKNSHFWDSGFLPRCALITPEMDRPEWLEPTAYHRPHSVTVGLGNLYKALSLPAYPEPARCTVATVDPNSFATWKRYNKALSYDLLMSPGLDGALSGTYGRLPTQALKVATILAALDYAAGSGELCIRPHHLARGIVIAEQWRASAHRVITLTRQGAEDRFLQRVKEAVRGYGTKGATPRDVMRSTGGKIDEIRTTLSFLEQSGEISRYRQESGSTGGRPAERYVITS